MQQLPTDLSRQDITQWLRGGFFYADLPDKPRTLVTFGEAHDGNSLVVMCRERGAVYQVPPSAIWTHWPMCGSINTPHGALYVQRRVERQWRRVYSGRYVTIEIPWEWEAIRRRPPLAAFTGDSHDVVNALFNPSYPGSVAEAMEMVAGPKAPGTVALNRLIIFDASGGVYYNGERIGALNEHQQLVPTCGERLARRVEKYIEGGLAL